MLCAFASSWSVTKNGPRAGYEVFDKELARVVDFGLEQLGFGNEVLAIAASDSKLLRARVNTAVKTKLIQHGITDAILKDELRHAA